MFKLNAVLLSIALWLLVPCSFELKATDDSDLSTDLITTTTSSGSLDD